MFFVIKNKLLTKSKPLYTDITHILDAKYLLIVIELKTIYKQGSENKSKMNIINKNFEHVNLSTRIFNVNNK